MFQFFAIALFSLRPEPSAVDDSEMAGVAGRALGGKSGAGCRPGLAD